MRPAAPSADTALPSGPARHWRRLAWWSLFVAGNALLAMAITLGNVPLADNPGAAWAWPIWPLPCPVTCWHSAPSPACCRC